MIVNFFKYQGTGNDFILIDNRKTRLRLNRKQIAKLCDRNFGIGADGLMLLENQKGYDFKMVYFNSDGNVGSMCGNGGRCLVKFARDRGIIKNAYLFLAHDGPHRAVVRAGEIGLKMSDSENPVKLGNGYFIDTGSPHYVKFVEMVKNVDVVKEGRRIRNSAKYKKEGVNVNFVEIISENTLFVRTYERGVENETLSCGTGATGAALVYAFKNNLQKGTIKIETPGGKLKVKFNKTERGFDDVWLIGPAVNSFSGKISIT